MDVDGVACSLTLLPHRSQGRDFFRSLPRALIVPDDAQCTAPPHTLALAFAPHDCLEKPPGSPAAGRKLDPTTDVGVVGPVTQAGDYKVCFMHRKDWEPTVLTVSVHGKSMVCIACKLCCL